MYGKIEYRNGKPICEICGKEFDRVLTHARQKHKISARKYKKKFGLENIKGICSKESSEKTRSKTLLHRKLVIDKNLLNNGVKTRFKKGSKGRTKDMMSTETRRKLAIQNKRTNNLTHNH